nr:hypothetical protein pmam_276 [Pithovirus mammoth]
MLKFIGNWNEFFVLKRDKEFIIKVEQKVDQLSLEIGMNSLC